MCLQVSFTMLFLTPYGCSRVNPRDLLCIRVRREKASDKTRVDSGGDLLAQGFGTRVQGNPSLIADIRDCTNDGSHLYLAFSEQAALAILEVDLADRISQLSPAPLFAAVGAGLLAAVGRVSGPAPTSTAFIVFRSSTNRIA